MSPDFKFQQMLTYILYLVSGDGTVRKNPTVWKDWNPGTGNGRHFIQFNLAERGVELLKVGGVMAYSSWLLSSLRPLKKQFIFQSFEQFLLSKGFFFQFTL